jgi:hypothetical protein
VGIDKPGHNGLASTVDALRAGTSVSRDIIANADNLIAGNRNSRCYRLRSISRVHMDILYDEIRGLR